VFVSPGNRQRQSLSFGPPYFNDPNQAFQNIPWSKWLRHFLVRQPRPEVKTWSGVYHKQLSITPCRGFDTRRIRNEVG
jgi:hypothetical protein